MKAEIQTDATAVAVLDQCLADLGTIVRRTRAGTLIEDDFETLMTRTRARLKHLRHLELLEETGIELTDAGAAVIAAQDLMRKPGVLDLFRRLPSLMTGRELADRPFARCPDRMRMVGHLGVVK